MICNKRTLLYSAYKLFKHQDGVVSGFSCLSVRLFIIVYFTDRGMFLGAGP